MYSKKILLLFLALLQFYSSQAQYPDSTRSFSDRISALEEQNNQLTLSLDSVQSQLGQQSEVYNLYDRTLTFFTKPLYLLSSLGLIVLLLILVYRQLRSFVKKHIQENYRDWIEEETKIIIQNSSVLWSEYADLKKRKRILIVNSETANQGFVEKFFKQFDFENYNIVSVQDVKLYENDFDVLFANNEDGKLDQQMLEDYVLKTDYGVLFYYSSIDYRWRNFQNIGDRLNFANSKAQVYGNLMSTLRYHDLKTPKL